MTKSRVEGIDDNDDRPLSDAEKKMLARVSKEGLRAGDILLFKIPDDPRMSDRFIQFAQRRKDLSEADAACVHVAVVTDVSPIGTVSISHYLNNGHVEETLKNSRCAYHQHEYDVIRVKDDNNNEIKGKIVREAREPKFAKESNAPTYSTLKAIVSFLRKQNIDPDKTRGYVPGYFAENNNREICSSFVARVVKKIQGKESKIDSSFLLPGQLRNALMKNPSFECNPSMHQTRDIPVTDERRPEAAVAAKGAAVTIIKRRVRKQHGNDDLFPASAESNTSNKPRM